MPRRVLIGRALLTTTLLLITGLTGAPSSANAAAAAGASAATAVAAAQNQAMTIEEQTAVLDSGDRFAIRVAVAADPDARVRIEMHRGLGSRIALQQQLADPALDAGPVLLRKESLPIGQRRHVVVRADAPERPGVYPVSVSLLGPDGAIAQRILTHVTRGPASPDDFPPLGVAMVFDARLPITFDGGNTALARRSAAREPLALAEQVAVRFPDLPLAFVVDPSDIPTVGSTNAFSDRHVLIATTYVPVDLDAALGADLQSELQQQVSTARGAVRAWTGTDPIPSLTVLDDTPTIALAEWLGGVGVSGLLVEPGRLGPLDPALFPVTMMQPFLVGGLGDLRAVEADKRLGQQVALLEGPADVRALVTELAVLQGDRPALPRALTLLVPLEPVEQPALVEDFLRQLDAHRTVIRPVALADAIGQGSLARADGTRQGEPLVREVRAATLSPDLTPLGASLAANRLMLDDYTQFVGRNSPNLEGLERGRIEALDGRRDPLGEQQRIDAVTADLRGRFAGIDLPDKQRITLTAREAELPVTIRRVVDHDVTVKVVFESEKLLFPEGDVLELTLTKSQTELNVPVVARTSGEFPVDIAVVSPSGAIVIAEGQLIVRSTAISGVGLVLGGGALLVLSIWWVRLIRRDRRDSRLATTPASS